MIVTKRVLVIYTYRIIEFLSILLGLENEIHK